MNDLEFYKFLREMPEQVFDAWITTASEEDLERAERVYQQKRYLKTKDDEAEDLSIVQEYLKKFTLKA